MIPLPPREHLVPRAWARATHGFPYARKNTVLAVVAAGRAPHCAERPAVEATGKAPPFPPPVGRAGPHACRGPCWLLQVFERMNAPRTVLAHLSAGGGGGASCLHIVLGRTASKVKNGRKMLSILLRIFGDAQHSCSANGTHIAGLISEVPAKISSELPRHGRLGSPWNIPTISVAFWDPIWLPKLPSIFPRDFKNFQAFFHRFFVQ